MSNQPVRREDIMGQAAQARGMASSQGTVIEQTRAVAEVQGALMVARQFPRDETGALHRAIDAAKQQEVADTAFWQYSRAGSAITGESIHLAVELARCWGNIEHKIAELARDDQNGVSEMMAVAWDLQTNTRATMSFLVPHARDTKQGQKRLVDLRDIYENNANAGARRMRECIFRVLPKWYVAAVVAECRKTLERGVGDKPLKVRIAEMVAEFAKIGVSSERIEAKVGRLDGLTEVQVANLRISYRSLSRGEIALDEAFPPVRAALAQSAAQDTANAIREVAGKARGQENKPAGEAAAEAAQVDARDLKKLEILEQIRAAKDPGELNERFTAATPQIEAMSDEAHDEITAAYGDRIASFRA